MMELVRSSNPQNIRKLVKNLQNWTKMAKYWKILDPSPDFTVMLGPLFKQIFGIIFGSTRKVQISLQIHMSRETNCMSVEWYGRTPSVWA